MFVNMPSYSGRSMVIGYIDNTEETHMASTKSSAKAAPAKRPAPATGATRSTPATKVSTAKIAVGKVVPKSGSKAAAAKPARTKPAQARAKKSAPILPEQRRNYIEMAAYYIAERRGFAPGNPLEDWVQAEAEIDRLLAEGRVGR